AGDDLGNAPRKEGMARSIVLGKRGRQDNRVVEAGVSAELQQSLGSCLIAIGPREFAEMKIDFPQPSGVRRLARMLDTPGQFFPRCLSLVEESRKLGMNHAGDPVHDKNLAAG